jgi:hypothetical protein
MYHVTQEQPKLGQQQQVSTKYHIDKTLILTLSDTLFLRVFFEVFSST